MMAAVSAVLRDHRRVGSAGEHRDLPVHSVRVPVGEIPVRRHRNGSVWTCHHGCGRDQLRPGRWRHHHRLRHLHRRGGLGRHHDGHAGRDWTSTRRTAATAGHVEILHEVLAGRVVVALKWRFFVELWRSFDGCWSRVGRHEVSLGVARPGVGGCGGFVAPPLAVLVGVCRRLHQGHGAVF